MLAGIAGIAGFSSDAAGGGVVDTSLYSVLAYRITTDDTSSTASRYNAEAYDVGGWHDNSSSSENLTVPSGVTYARFIANNRRAGAVTIQDRLEKGGASFVGRAYPNSRSPGAEAANAATAIVAVAAGNTFAIVPGGTTGGTNWTDIDSWFAAEAIPSTRKMALLAKASNQTLASSTTTTLTFATETRDTDNWHSNIASTVTITIASPGVVSWTAHGFLDGSPIVLTTTGALPTGLTAGAIYYVVSAAANTFRLATAPGGSAINTSGSQSGTHTATNTSRLVVPSGVSLVRVSAGLVAAAVGGADQLVLSGLKDGASVVGMFQCDHEDIEEICGVSAILAVSSADYFECRAFNTGGSTINSNDGTWFQIEEIDAATKYALANKSGTQAISASTFTAVAWGTETADTHAFHDNSSNNSRLTIPAGQGITQARLSFNLSSASATGQFIGEVRKNGSSTPVPGLPRQECDTAGTDNINGFGAWVDVTSGDYFELFVFADSAQTLPVSDTSWFCIECR